MDKDQEKIKKEIQEIEFQIEKWTEEIIEGEQQISKLNEDIEKIKKNKNFFTILSRKIVKIDHTVTHSKRLNKKIAKIEKKIAKIEKKIAKIEKKIAKIENNRLQTDEKIITIKQQYKQLIREKKDIKKTPSWLKDDYEHINNGASPKQPKSLFKNFF